MRLLRKTVSILTARHALSVWTLVLIGAILFLGLRPETWPVVNEIHWSADKNCLSFNNTGFGYVDNLHSFQGRTATGEFSIRLLVATDNLQERGFKPIVMLHDGSDLEQLTISQWGKSIIVMNGDDYNYSRRLPRISTEAVLIAGKPMCFTVTSGDGGTRLFSDGSLIYENSGLRLNIPHKGEKLRLILGNSVYGKHGWEGDVYSLALYDTQLPPETLLEDCQGMPSSVAGQPPANRENIEHRQLFFTFKAPPGDMVADQSGNNQPLLLPSRPLALKKVFLAAPWQNFILNRNLIIDIIANFFGFIPLATVLYLRLRLSSSPAGKRPALFTFLCCFLLSLLIEVAQGWLPGRTSSVLDLVLNSSGAAVGVGLVMIAGTASVKPFWQFLHRKDQES